MSDSTMYVYLAATHGQTSAAINAAALLEAAGYAVTTATPADGGGYAGLVDAAAADLDALAVADAVAVLPGAEETWEANWASALGRPTFEVRALLACAPFYPTSAAEVAALVSMWAAA